MGATLFYGVERQRSAPPAIARRDERYAADQSSRQGYDSAGTAAPTPEQSRKRSFRTRKNRGQRPRLQREFLSQIEDEFPVAVHVRAPDHDIDSMLNDIPRSSLRLAQYFFPVTAVGAKAIPSSAKYSTLAAGIPLATDRLEYSRSILAISRAAEVFRG